MAQNENKQHILNLTNSYMRTVEQYLETKTITPQNLLTTSELYSIDKILHACEYEYIIKCDEHDKNLHCGCDIDDWYMYLLFEKQMVVDSDSGNLPTYTSSHWTLPITDKIQDNYKSHRPLEKINAGIGK